MWLRNLVFLAIVVAGGLTLRASLFPSSGEARQVKFERGPTQQDEFKAVVSEVDGSFRARWSEAGLTPALPANDLTVARRLSLALTGTVPSLEEIRQFEAQPAAARLDGWTNHLLHDRRFADYFSARLARACVGLEDGPIISYRKRRFFAWLSDELLNNTSYAEIVRQMIAGQGLNTDKPAVNFIAATYDDNNKSPDPEKLAIRVSRAFLGWRVDCAQCHDFYDQEHPKFDDEGRIVPNWKQTEFQSLAAFFGQTKQSITNIADSVDGDYQYEDRVHGGKHKIDPAVPSMAELLPSRGTRRERLAGWVTDRQNVHFARAAVNRVWAMMTGRPLLKQIEARTLEEPIPPVLDILAKDFSGHGHDLKRLIMLIASTEAYRLDSAASFEITAEHEANWAVFPLTPMRPEQVIGNVIQAASVTTIDQNSHVFTRLARYFNEKDFVKRYGDADDDELAKAHGTIPQRLLMMNGELVDAKARDELLNGSAQIAMFAQSDAAAVETAYLAVLTRRPSKKESDHFVARLVGITGDERKRRLADLYWVLFNSTELSWNH